MDFQTMLLLAVLFHVAFMTEGEDLPQYIFSDNAKRII